MARRAFPVSRDEPLLDIALRSLLNTLSRAKPWCFLVASRVDFLATTQFVVQSVFFAGLYDEFIVIFHDNPVVYYRLGGSEAGPMGRYLHIGGLVAVGFDASGTCLLTITHSGRGVFSTRPCEHVARSSELAYTEGGVGIGIGPIDGQSVQVTEMDYDTGEMQVIDPGGRFVLECESSGIAVVGPVAKPCAAADTGRRGAFLVASRSLVGGRVRSA